MNMRSTGKVAVGMATLIGLKFLLEGAGTLPPPTDEWLAPAHAMEGPLGVGQEHLPDHIHYFEASSVPVMPTSGSPSGTAVGDPIWTVQVGGETLVF